MSVVVFGAAVDADLKRLSYALDDLHETSAFSSGLSGKIKVFSNGEGVGGVSRSRVAVRLVSPLPHLWWLGLMAELGLGVLHAPLWTVVFPFVFFGLPELLHSYRFYFLLFCHSLRKAGVEGRVRLLKHRELLELVFEG